MYYEEHGELCAQCRLEEMHLGRMKVSLVPFDP